MWIGSRSQAVSIAGGKALLSIKCSDQGENRISESTIVAIGTCFWPVTDRPERNELSGADASCSLPTLNPPCALSAPIASHLICGTDVAPSRAPNEVSGGPSLTRLRLKGRGSPRWQQARDHMCSHCESASCGRLALPSKAQAFLSTKLALLVLGAAEGATCSVAAPDGPEDEPAEVGAELGV